MHLGNYRKAHRTLSLLFVVLLFGSATATWAQTAGALFVSNHGKGAALLPVPRGANEIITDPKATFVADGTPLRQLGPEKIVGNAAWKPVETDLPGEAFYGWIRASLTSPHPPASASDRPLAAPRVADPRPRLNTAAPASQTILPSSPSNDSFAQAVTINPIPSGFTVPSTSDASVENGEPTNVTCGGSGFGIGKTVWYRYVATTSQTITISTAGSDFDTTLIAWRNGSLGHFTTGYCNDEFGADSTSQISFPTVAGETFMIQVGGYFSSNFEAPADADFGNLQFTGSPGGSGTPDAVSGTLHVLKVGQGTVTSSDGGINCGGVCTHEYTLGTSVTVNANAASGWGFDQWFGECFGVDPACQFPIVGNVTQTALFVNCTPRPPVHLMVGKSGDGRIRVYISPGIGLIKEVVITPDPITQVSVSGGPSNVSGSYKPPGGAGVVVLLIARTAPPNGAFARLVVVDACGSWPTFAGAGSNPSNWQ